MYRMHIRYDVNKRPVYQFYKDKRKQLRLENDRELRQLVIT